VQLVEGGKASRCMDGAVLEGAHIVLSIRRISCRYRREYTVSMRQGVQEGVGGRGCVHFSM
jgi:hypothetical protein